MKALWRWSAGLLLIAAALAPLRWLHTTRVLERSDLRLGETHAITWDAATGTFTKTGDDPYAWFELPSSSIPLQRVVMEFDGPPYQGISQFYIYQFPAYVDGVTLNDSDAVRGERSEQPGGFRVSWKLNDSKILRFDLPDDLSVPIHLRRLTLVSGSYGSWSVTVMWLCLVAGLALPLAGMLPRIHARWPMIEPLILFGLIVGKVAVASDLHLTVIGWAIHDDSLFIHQAHSIMHGKWLGTFGDVTLAKGPVYSIFLALVGWLHTPLLVSEAAFHAVACVVFVWALRPLLASVNARLFLFTALLFDPHTLSAEAMSRVLRSGIQPALTLLALGGAIGLGLRLREPLRRALGWAGLAGVAFTLFWFSREEGVWLVPSLVVVAVASLAVAWSPKAGRLRLAVTLAPIAIFFLGQLTLREINRAWYRAPMTIDVKDGDFPAAYGALMRIRPAQPRVDVPVARESWQRAYAVSPTFATLRSQLDGPVGELWERLSRGANQAGDGEIHGGWFQWALRDAAGRTGHYSDAAAASAFWREVAREINQACDSGALAGGPRRSGLFPRWDSSRWAPLRAAIVQAAGVAADFTDFRLQFPPMENSAADEKLFTHVTHEPVLHGYAPPTFRTDLRIAAHHLYRWAAVPASVVATLAFLVLALIALWRKTAWLELAILIALAGGAFAIMVVAALVDVTSFSAIHAMYLVPATPLLISCWVLAPVWLKHHLPHLRRPQA